MKFVEKIWHGILLARIVIMVFCLFYKILLHVYSHKYCTDWIPVAFQVIKSESWIASLKCENIHWFSSFYFIIFLVHFSFFRCELNRVVALRAETTDWLLCLRTETNSESILGKMLRSSAMAQRWNSVYFYEWLRELCKYIETPMKQILLCYNAAIWLNHLVVAFCFVFFPEDIETTSSRQIVYRKY